MSTDWPAIHEKVVEQFCTGWDNPDPHAWDEFIEPSMRFVQPMLKDVVGPERWASEAARLLHVLPDLRADVLHWAGSGDTLFIHLRFTATLGRRPITWDAVDQLRLTPAGTAVFRESFFDSVPVATQLARHPRALARWVWSAIRRTGARA